MANGYYKGNVKYDSRLGRNSGWIVGSFMQDSSRRTDLLEIKYWQYPIGPTDHLCKKSIGVIEVAFVLRGETIAEIGDDRFILKAGEYVVIQPDIPNNTVVEILSEAVGLTVKSPSITTAKESC